MPGWQVKVCKTCRFWSEAVKGQCTKTSTACGQFWRCEQWSAEDIEAEAAGS